LQSDRLLFLFCKFKWSEVDMARIEQLRPEYVINEKMQHVDSNRWKVNKKFIQNSLEVFWNGQRLVPQDSEDKYDYAFVDDQVIEILGVDSSDNNSIVKKDIITCNYLVKV
jgi:hypothetical protein